MPLPIANLVEQTQIQAMNRGWAQKDASVTFLQQEEMPGVEVRTSARE